MIEKEEWFKIEGYGDRFAVSSHGRLMNYKTGKILSQTLSRNGYLCHSTKIGGRNGKTVLLRIHRLVAESFVENPDQKPFVNHIDGNKQNNHCSNLEWCTASENMQHAYDSGLLTVTKGEERVNSILTEELVRKIKELYVPGRKNGFGKRKIAKQLNLPIGAVQHVITGKSWSHIE